MPGVIVGSSLRTGPSTPAGEPAGRAFMAGITERGPIGASSKIQSLAQYQQVYGSRQTYSANLYDAVQTFFEEGGSELWIARVVGSTPVYASLTLQDRGTTPQPTLKISALNPGAFAAQYLISVADGTTGTFTISVLDGSNGNAVLETWPNLADVPTAVTTLANSAYIRGTDQHSTNTPTTSQIPAVHAATALAGGDDNRSTINSASILGGLGLFGAGLGSGAVCTPGYSADQVAAGVGAHCVTNRRIGLLAGVQTASVSALTALAATLTQYGQYLGLFGPWVQIPDGAGGTRIIDPVGYVAGVRARAMATGGFWLCRPARSPRPGSSWAPHTPSTRPRTTRWPRGTCPGSSPTPLMWS